MAASIVPSWRMPGQVTDVRALKSSKDQQVWAHVVQVMAMGGMFELMTKDEKLAKSVAVGNQVVASGRFEQNGNAVRLFVTEFNAA